MESQNLMAHMVYDNFQNILWAAKIQLAPSMAARGLRTDCISCATSQYSTALLLANA